MSVTLVFCCGNSIYYDNILTSPGKYDILNMDRKDVTLKRITVYQQNRFCFAEQNYIVVTV